ncbi:MAG: hypothetical protein ACTHKS_00165 [Gaiellaceae bacterium]
MQRGLVLSVAFVAAVGGIAAAAQADRGWAPPGAASVGPVDVAAGSVAGGIGWTHSTCEGAVLWLPGLRQRWLFRVPGPCPRTSTGRGVSAVAVSDQRVVFLSYVGGNTREWRLWTATPTAKLPRLLRTASADADAAPPILLGNGSETGIPYAVGRDVVVLASDGHRVLSWRAPTDIVSLSLHSGWLAATLADGTVQTVSLLHPTTAASYAQPGARAAEAITGGVVIDATDGIHLRKGSRALRFDVPAGAHMIGYSDGWLTYATGREIHLYSYQLAQDIPARTVRSTPVAADADRGGMGWTNGGALCWSISSYLRGKPIPFSTACDR